MRTLDEIRKADAAIPEPPFVCSEPGEDVAEDRRQLLQLHSAFLDYVAHRLHADVGNPARPKDEPWQNLSEDLKDSWRAIAMDTVLRWWNQGRTKA